MATVDKQYGPFAVHEFPRAAGLIQVGYDTMCDYLQAHPGLSASDGTAAPRREVAV
ncbi:MAG TPA: hypothetical protein VLC95_12075 [Anaerolineae bacterium]|nr:hypothetical protein [Anaerolineae bacterium]